MAECHGIINLTGNLISLGSCPAIALLLPLLLVLQGIFMTKAKKLILKGNESDRKAYLLFLMSCPPFRSLFSLIRSHIWPLPAGEILIK